MIEFVSLFLGLLVGPRPVELAVDDSVAAVELSLDGRQVARLDGPPWSTTVDLGPELLPHRLEAQALDAGGRRLERVSKLINTSSSNYAVSIALDLATGAGRRTGRIVWRAVLDRQPTVLDARFDGQPLAIDSSGRFVLPTHAPGKRHAIEVVLGFKDGRSARADLTFGGGFGERVTSSLTAVPITFRNSGAGAAMPISAEDVEGWFEQGGEPLSIFGTATEPGRLFVLRDESVVSELGWLERRSAGLGLERAEPAEYLTYRVTAISPRPVAKHQQTFKLVDLGPVDQEGGLLPLLLSSRPLVRSGSGREKLLRRQKLWESLAVAGLNAAATNRPRAVLLLLGVAPEDESLLAAAQTARYLSSVRVPLFVWTPLPETLERLDLGDSARYASGLAGLDQTIRRIAVELASQTIVWAEGEYLPTEVTLGAAAPPDVALVR